MNIRERGLSVILAGFLVLMGIGFVAYQFVLAPLNKVNRQINDVTDEIAQKETDLLAIVTAKKKFESVRQTSLPGDAKISRGLYSRMLKSLLERAGFPAGSFKLVVAEPDAKTSPIIEGKKTAYTKLSYTVTARGELFYFVEFLQHFYEQPLLHMVKSINIQRPSDAKSQAKAELDVVFTIEAIVLDNAYDRGTLFAPMPTATALAGSMGSVGLVLHSFESGKGSVVPVENVLAEPKRDYQSISTKNIFYGAAPPPPVTVTEEPTAPPEDDISNFVTLTSIVGHPLDRQLVAVFRDKLNNNEYTVTQTEFGKISVEATFDLNGRKKPMYKAGGQEIIYGSNAAQNKRVFRVRRINSLDVILEEVFEQKTKEEKKEKLPYPLIVAGGIWSAISLTDKPCSMITVGQSMDSVTPLTSREAFKAIYAKPPVLEVDSADKGR